MAAEIIVSCLVGKLADAVINEVLFLHGVGEKVESMKRELERIQCFLKDADMKPKGDARVQHWVSEVRGVAFRIEDAIDTFIADIERINIRNDTKKMPTIIPRKIIARHKLGSELDAIKALITEISESRSKYGILNPGEGSRSKVKQPVRRLVIPEIDETVVVGFKTDKEAIVKQLLDESISRLSVVSIVGQGGLGKTTLAIKTYKSAEVQKNFDIRIWVSISQEFQLIDVLKKMLAKIRPITQAELNMGVEYFIIKLNESLKNKKYLIVIDDVWTNNFWTQVKQAFPDFKNGSRVLITTRFLDVVNATNPASEPYKLCLLNENESLEVFLKNAIPYKECPNDLFALAKQFAQKCGGLPLALEVLGCFLSKKSLTYSDWDKVLKEMNWNTVGETCMEIIATSYEDLPSVLKFCFMYFILFPKDYKIEVKSLVRMWVAEGFISKEENQTLEETANDYLEELAERSMVQVSERDYDGSIMYCSLHDLLHDLAIHKAKEDNFFAVFSNYNNHTNSNTIRRAAFHYNCSHESTKCINPNLRSLVWFSGSPDCSNFRLLRVLAQIGEDSSHCNPIGFTNLRYLKVNISYNFCCEAITHMKNLQTIDLSDCRYLDKVPDSMWNIKTLRHIILPKGFEYGPPASADLKYLQTLTNALVKESWRKGLPNLPDLRELEVRVKEPNLLGVVNNFLSRLVHLVRFRLFISSTVDTEMLKISAFPSCIQFSHLEVDNIFYFHRCHLPFDASLFPANLVELTLKGFKFQRDIIPDLAKLTNLKKLKLSQLETLYEHLTCSVGSFCQLRTLELFEVDLTELKIEKGAFPILKQLTVTHCDSLRPAGLQHVTTLQNFTWRWLTSRHREEILSREEEIQSQIKHVPFIIIDD